MAAQESNVTRPPAGLGETFSSHFALDATAQDEPASEATEACTEFVGAPQAENTTKEKVIHALQSVVLEIGDKGVYRQANTVISLLQHQSFEARLLRFGLKSIP